MSRRIVVIGAGYAGSAAIKKLESISPPNTQIYWISKNPYHFMLHKSYKIIRNPKISDIITIPVEEIKNEETNFIEGEMTNINLEERSIELVSGDSIDYDYCLVAIGSKTAHYDIPGIKDHGLFLNNLKHARKIHKKIKKDSKNSSKNSPAKIFIGGSGLTGIQCVGEIVAYKRERDLPIKVHLIEALDKIFPTGKKPLRERLRKKLEKLDVEIFTGKPIVEVDSEKIYFDNNESSDYDTLIWAGGITGLPILEQTGLDLKKDTIYVNNSLQTSNQRVFAAGDTAFIDLEQNPAPPTAYVAWESAEIAVENMVRQMKGKPLKNWEYENPGTLVSVGDKAFAYNVKGIPIKTFNSTPAKFLKKLVASRWTAHVSSITRALKVWYRV